jgi:hypothetical protein
MMAREFAPAMQKIIKARSTRDEVEVVAEVKLRQGWSWEQLDFPDNKRKRPEGCVLIEGKRSVVLEVKRAESGGRSDDGMVMLSDLDPDLVGAGVKRFPAIPPAVEKQLDHAREKYVELTEDSAHHRGLPYAVVYYSNDLVSLNLVDRRLPTRREISGLIYIERGRRLREALDAMPEAELDRRVNSMDVSNLPSGDEIEWRLIPNPYAMRTVPPEFRETCRVGWPGEVPWPDHLTPDGEARAREAFAALSPVEQTVLQAVYWLFGRADLSNRDLAPARPVLESLARTGLALQVGESLFELTTEGLTLGLVRDLNKRPARP